MPRVTAVDVGIKVFHVDKPSVYNIGYGLNIGGCHIERSLNIDFPLRSAKFSEPYDKIRIKQRFASAESYSAACGEEIQLVCPDFFIQRFGRMPQTRTIVCAALRIETIATTEPAAMKGGKRGNAVAVGRHPMARHTDKRNKLLFAHNFTFLVLAKRLHSLLTINSSCRICALTYDIHQG